MSVGGFENLGVHHTQVCSWRWRERPATGDTQTDSCGSFTWVFLSVLLRGQGYGTCVSILGTEWRFKKPVLVDTRL